MEAQVHIRKRPLTYMEYLVLSLIVTQNSSSALSTNSDQTIWERCKFESLDFDLSLCNPGSVRNTYPYSCSPKKRCCPCPSGAFMDSYNNCSVCIPLRDCEAEGKQVLFKGSATQDTVCGDDILATTVSWSTVPVMMATLPQAVESTSAGLRPNERVPHLSINATCNPPGADEGGGGTSVIRFNGGSAVVVFLGTLLVISIFVNLFFIGYPKIPKRLHALLSKKKQKNFNAIPVKDLELGGGKVTDV